MKIAILGFGTIGSGVYEIIKDYPAKQIKDIEVTHILDLPQNKNKLNIITSDIHDITSNSNIDCVIETMGGLHPAYEFIKACLQSKKHVITANKAVVAAHLEEFTSIAKEHNVSFLFEASTGGGIPWIASLNKAKRIDSIEHFYGIFNGTTNYILDSMYHEGKDFDVVLKTAQALGYAEADPSADVDGYDVQNKIVISSAIAFNSKINMNDFPCFGIRNLNKHDIDYFKQIGFTPKFIGEASITNDTYEAYAMPNLFQTDAVEANVKSNFNIATLYGKSIGALKFYGQGAGKLPTANAIIQDIFDLYNEQANYHLDFKHRLTYMPTQENTYVIRSNEDITASYILKKEMYQKVTYVYTIPLLATDMLALVNKIEDKNLFICKIANFRG